MKKWMHIMVLLPFILCAGFLLFLGKSLGLSYKHISVIFNLYLQGVILLLSGILPMVCSIYELSHAYIYSWLIMIGCTSYASIYVVAFVGLLKHYHLPMDYAFDLCVKDLQAVSKSWGISYHAVNLIIFIWWWIALVGMNVLVSYSMLRKF